MVLCFPAMADTTGSIDEQQKNCPHLGYYGYYCDHCGGFIPTPQEMEDWKKNSPASYRAWATWESRQRTRKIEEENRKKRLLNAHQVEEMLNVPAVTEHLIRQYARLGTLPSVKVGNEVLFDPLEIAEWVRIMRSIQARRSA